LVFRCREFVNWKFRTIIVLLAVGALVGGAIVVGKARSARTVTVTLRIRVTPAEQSDFVIRQANSARFKYLVGKRAGVKPIIAQKLSIKTAPNSSFLEARVEVMTKDEARRYAEAFVETLQAECDNQAQVTLAQQSVH